MNDYLNIKSQLLKHCVQFVQQKKAVISKSIESNKNDLLSETKSSAGDKHETGRAMIQLEMEKASQQLGVVLEMEKILERVQIKKLSSNIKLGSLVETTKGIYFLAISIGEVKINKKSFYIVSSQSPIGMQLLGKKIGEVIPFNKAKILEII